MKKLVFLFTSILAMVLFTTVGCKKEPKIKSNLENATSNQFEATDRDGTGATVLGPKRANPYKVDVIKQAYNKLYEPDITTLLPNYLYVRFLPTTPADVKKLLESGLELTDFPLDYEIVNFGERYHDPSISDSTYTWQYAIIDVNTPMPTVQHEVLEELAVVSEDSPIAQEAFNITNNTFDVPDEFDPNPILENNRFKFKPNHESSNSAGGTRGGECNCIVPDHIRKPSGCVQVFDNALGGFEGVRAVDVITAKVQIFSFIFHQKTTTDLEGCWKINKKYKGHINMWVKFESSFCDIKVMEGRADLWGYSFPRRSNMGKFWGPNFNNISTKFDFPPAFGKKPYFDWMAATMNNSVHQFGLYCGGQNLPAPRGNLKILITPWDNSGACIMLDKMGAIPNFLLISTEAAIFGLFGVLNPGVGVVGFLLAAWMTVCAPDIVINRTFVDNTDQLKETEFHELAHAMHFDKAGQWYWIDNIAYVVGNLINGNNPPYGTVTTAGAGRCAIIEAWCEHIGVQATHDRYGLNHTNSTTNMPFNTYQAMMERDLFFDAFIPYAWQADLVDDNSLNPQGTIENPAVTDRVSGYTRAQIFSTMSSSMLSPSQQKASLITILPPGVSVSDMNTLATPYGF